MPKITDMIDFRASHFFGGLLFEKILVLCSCFGALQGLQ